MNRLVANLKNGGLQRVFKNSGLGKGKIEKDFDENIANPNCRKVFNGVKATYQSMEASFEG